MYNWPLMDNNVTREDLDILIEYLKKDNKRLTQGEQVELFEKEWSKWLGVKHSVFVNSGASANFITMDIMHDLTGDGEVIISPLNWVSDIVATAKAGYDLKFVDINMDNLGLDSNAVKEAINENTKAVLLTHIMGYNALDDNLLDITIPLVEDVCESHGAKFKKLRCGTFGVVSNFSFYFAHHMSTIEGGMICTDVDEIYQRALMYRSHGMARECNDSDLKEFYINKYNYLNKDFIFMYPGYNMRSTEINAIIGRNQIKHLDNNIRIRNFNNNLFNSNLDEDKYYRFDENGSSNYGFIVVTKDTNLTEKVIKLFKEEDIEFRQGLSGGGNQMLQPYMERFKNNSVYDSDFKNINWVHNNGFYFGNYPSLDVNKVYDIVKKLNRI